MSTIQSDNKKNIFYQKENNHNLISLCFFIILTLLTFIMFLVSSLLGIYSIMIFAFIFLIGCAIKTVNQAKSITSFNSLLSKIEEENISIYITKSWLRKKQAVIWIGLTSIFISFVFLIISIALINVYNSKELMISLSIIIITIFTVIIAMYVDLQMINGYLKGSERKIDLYSIEWKQIEKEYSIIYKSIFIWSVHICLILPLILFIFPIYRKWTKIFIKN